MATTVISIDIGRVRPFAGQPREYFDSGELLSLELSIKQRGQLQPAMVRRLTGDRDHDYELVDGQRRWHACTRLNIPLRAMIIDPANPEDQYEIAVAANFQRAEHTPMEIAKAIERMCTQGNRTEEYAATLFGKSPAWVSLQRRLIDLIPEIQAMLEPKGSKEQLPVAVAVHLARLAKEQQQPILEEIQARGLSSKQAADKIRRILLNGEPQRRQRSATGGRDIQRFIRRTIQNADYLLDKMGPDDLRLIATALQKKRSLDEVRDTVMTAIGRLEVLHRRLTECKAAMPATPPPALPKPAATSKPAAAPATHVFSALMTCPKCKSTRTRFKRRAEADLQKDHWICETKGCQLKISHYSIKVDRAYRPEMGV